MVGDKLSNEKNYGLLTDIQEIKEYVGKIINENKVFAFDIETGYDGPNFKDAAKLHFYPHYKVVGISFTNDTSWARYIPLAHDNGQNAPMLPTVRLMWAMLRTGRGIAHNAPFELQGMARLFREVLWDDTFFATDVRKSYGFYPVFSDTMIEAFMTQEYQPLGPGGGVGVGLKPLTYFVFGHKMTNFDDLFPVEDSELGPGTPRSQNQYKRFNTRNLVPKVIEYACEDSAWCLALHEENYPKVSDMFMFKVEIQLMTTLAEMEYQGIALDWAEYHRRAEEISVFLTKMNEEIQTELSERLGEVVNVNLGSPKQVAELLYEKLQLPVQLDKKTKRPSTGEVALRNLVREHPILRRILQWREVKKLLSSYIDKYRNELNYALDGKAHANHKQIGAATGRFSVDHVSYQQWPKPYDYELQDGTKLYLNYRNFLKAPDGFRIVGYDFSQVELRVLAGMANEKDLLHAFNTGVDVHTQTASTMKKIPLDQVSEKDRADGKTLNFAVVYGSGADNIASMLGVTKEEAQQMLDDYFAAFSGLRSWMDDRVIEGQTKGIVNTHFGRKFKVWEYVDAADKAALAAKTDDPEKKDNLLKMSRIARSKGDRMCVNAPVQGGAADYMKIGMVRVRKAIRDAGLEDKIVLVMTIHDALEFYVHESITTQQVIDLVAPQVTFKVDGLPEIRADWHEGKRWGDVVEIKLDADKKIKGYEWKKKSFDTLDEAYKAQEDALIAAKEEEMAEPEAPTELEAHITLPDLPEAAEWEKFKAYLSERPGPAKVILHLPGADKTLDTTALLFGSDVDNIKRILTGSEVEIRKAEVNA